MLSSNVLGSAIAAAGAGSTVTMNVSPFFPRHKVMARIDVSDDFAGQMKIQSSDDNSTWGDVLDTGVLAASADKTEYEVEVTLKAYMRYNMVSRTAGNATAKLVSGS